MKKSQIIPIAGDVLLVICFTIILSGISKAQVPEVLTYDTITNSFDKPFPVERPSKLIFNGEKFTAVNQALVYQLYHRKGQFWIYEEEKDSSKLLKPNRIDPVTIQKNEKSIYVNLPRIKPNKSYVILLRYSYSGDSLACLYKLNGAIYKSEDTLANTLFREIYCNQILKLDNTSFYNQKVNRKNPQKFTFIRPDYQEYEGFFKEKIKQEYDYLSRAFISLEYLYLTSDTLCKVAGMAAEGEVDIESLINLQKVISTNHLKNFQNGIITTEEFEVSEEADLLDYKKRSQHLKKSKKYCKEMLINMDRFILVASCNEETLMKVKMDISKLNEVISKNDEVLDKHIKRIDQAIISNKDLSYPSLVLGNSDFINLKTKGTYRVVPALGLAYSYANSNDTANHLFRPYVGASFNFRPVDKNIPFRYYKCSFLMRSSINVGLTIGEITDKNYKDFFNKMSLLLGYNFKLTQEFALSGGIMLMQRRAQGGEGADYEIFPRFYFGMSIDLDFMNSISKLTDKVY